MFHTITDDIYLAWQQHQQRRWEQRQWRQRWRQQCRQRQQHQQRNRKQTTAALSADSTALFISSGSELGLGSRLSVRMSFIMFAPGMPGWLPIGSWVQVAGYGFSIPPAEGAYTLPGPMGDARNHRIMYLNVYDSRGRPAGLIVQVAVMGFLPGRELVLRNI